MSPRGAKRWAGWRRLIGAPLTLATIVACVALPATAQGKGRDVSKLFSAACPDYRVVHSGPQSDGSVASSRTWVFDVVGQPTRLKPKIDWGNRFGSSDRRQEWLHNLGWLDVLFYRYQQGDLGALAQARSIVFDWIRRNPQDDPAMELAWRNKIVADRAAEIGYLTRSAACHGMLNRRQAKTLLDSLREHGKFLLRTRSDSNHGLFVNIGLVLVGHYLEFTSEARRWTRLGQSRFVSQLARTVSPSGIWREQSVGYHFLVTDLVRLFSSYVPNSDQIPALVDLRTRMEAAGRWFVMPDGLPFQVGDTFLNPAPCWARQPTPAGCQAAPDSPVEGLMIDSGYAIVKDPPGHAGSYFGVTDGYFSKAHHQADELSFDLFEGGQRLIADSGHYGNDDGAHRTFSASDRAHSLLTVGGGFATRKPYGNGLVAAGFDPASDWYGVLGRNRPLKSLRKVSEHRLYLYLPGRALIVIDNVSSKKKQNYQRYFQLGPGIDVAPAGGNAFSLSAPGLSARLIDASPAGGVGASSVRGRAKPRLGFTYPNFHVGVPRWTVLYSSRAKKAVYVAAIGINDYLQNVGIVASSTAGATVSVTPTVDPPFTVSASAGGGVLTISQSP